MRFKQLKQVEKAQARKLMGTTETNEAYNQISTESDKSDGSFKAPERILDKLSKQKKSSKKFKVYEVPPFNLKFDPKNVTH